MMYVKCLPHMKGFSGGSDGKEFACSAGDLGSSPGSERSPVEGNVGGDGGRDFIVVVLVAKSCPTLLQPHGLLPH